MTVKLSPSRMNLYFECERCFWLRVNKGIRRPSGPFPSLPGGMDTRIKEHFDSYRERGENPPEIEEAGIDARLFEDQIFLEKARDWRREPKWKDPETGALLRGGVDDLLRSGNGNIIVLDYKTRGSEPRKDEGVPVYYSRQLNLYNLMMRENGYETADFGLILYYYPEGVAEDGNFVFKREWRRSNVNIRQAKLWVRNAVEILESEIPDQSDDCEFCGWSLDNHVG